MKIGLDNLLSDDGPARLIQALHRHAIKQGPDPAAKFREEAGAIRATVITGIKRLRRLRAKRSNGNAWCRAETKKMFQSRDFQTTAALVQAAIKEEVISISEARHLADCARDLAKNEGVSTEAIEKPCSGERIIAKFGPVKSVRNRAMALMVEAVSGPFEFEFCQYGKGGVHAAAKYIGECLIRDYRFWITCDLTSAYPSVKKGHVEDEIPVHGHLLRAVGFPLISHNELTDKEGARPGLAEGASHSSKILSAFIDGPLRQIGGSNKVLCYADNIAIGARTPDKAKCAFNTFKNAISENKAGPIHLHSVSLHDGFQHHGHGKEGNLLVRHAVDFCQYRISYDICDGKVRYRANNKAFARAKKKAIARIEGATDEDEMEAIVDAYLKNWMKSFKLWTPNANTLECLMQNRDLWVYEHLNGKTFDKVADATPGITAEEISQLLQAKFASSQ